MNMHAEMDTVMAQVVRALVTSNRIVSTYAVGHRIKVLVHDGLNIWLCAPRLEQSNQRLEEISPVDYRPKYPIHVIIPTSKKAKGWKVILTKIMDNASLYR